MVCFSCHLEINPDSHAKRECQLKNSLHQIELSVCLESIFHVLSCWTLSQSTICAATCRQVGLGCTRKVDEQSGESKPLSRIPPWSLLQFLPLFPAWHRSVMNSHLKVYDQRNPTVSQADFVQCLIIRTEWKLEEWDS